MTLPTKAEHLAAVITKTGDTTYSVATIQRSHRFPLHIFTQIENMASKGDVPVSLIINDLLEIGLDAVKQKLPEDVALEISQITPDQLNRPSITDKVDTKERKAKAPPKAKLIRAK